GRKELTIYGKKCVFGNKDYIIEIIDKYGYRIELYFTLKAEQSPYVAYSGYNFVEGKSYVIGSEYASLSTAYNTSNTTTGSGLSVVASNQNQDTIRTTNEYLTDIGSESGKTFMDSVIIGGTNAYGYAENPVTFKKIVDILEYFENTTNKDWNSQTVKQYKEKGLTILKSIALPVSITTKKINTLAELAETIRKSLENQIVALNMQTEFSAIAKAGDSGSYNVQIIYSSDALMDIKITENSGVFSYGDITIDFTTTLGLKTPENGMATKTFNNEGKKDIDKNISITVDTKATTDLYTEYLQPFSIVSNNYNQYINSSSIERITLQSVNFLATDGKTSIGSATVLTEDDEDLRLATNSNLKNYNGGGDFDTYKHKGADKANKAAAFKVGYLDSYVYGEGHESGSGKSVVANVVLTLKYEEKVGEGDDEKVVDEETATVVINSATISREYPEALISKDVHDGTSFGIKSILNTTNKSLSDTEFNVYNDTLEIVLDPGVNIKFNITATTTADDSYPNYSSTALKATVTKNAIYNYKARYYVGISNSLGRAIDNTYDITISNIEATGNYEIRYNGKPVTAMTPFKVEIISDEIFNIENSAQWEGGDSIVKTKYYLVNPKISITNGNESKYFYRYRVDYNVKRAYDVTAASSIVIENYYKTNNGYVIPIKDWALDDDDKIALTQGPKTDPMDISNVYKFNFVINTRHSGASGSAGAAFIDENGTIYTTSGFNITYHEIVLDMYLKASGFNGNFEVANMDRDKKVGTITIVLSNKDNSLVDAITGATTITNIDPGLYKLKNISANIFIGINNTSAEEKGYIARTSGATELEKVTEPTPATNKEFYISMDSGRGEKATLTYDNLKSLLGTNAGTGVFTNYHIYNVNGVYYNSSNLNSWTFTSTGTYKLKVYNLSGTSRSEISYHQITVYVYDVADIEEASYAIDYNSYTESGGSISVNLTTLINISSDYVLSEEQIVGNSSSFVKLTNNSLNFVSSNVNKIISKRILATNSVTGSIKTYLLTFYIYHKNVGTTYQDVKFAVAGENSFEIRSLKGLVDRTGEPTFYAVDSASGKMSILSADYITTLKSDNDTIKTAVKYLMVYNTTATTNNIMFVNVIPYVYSNVFTGYLPVIYDTNTSEYSLTGIADAIKRNIIKNSSLDISEITDIKVHKMHESILNVFNDNIETTQKFVKAEKNKQVAHKYFVEYTFDGKTKFASFNFNYYVATEEKASYNYISEVTNAASLISIFKSKFNNPSTAPIFYEIIDGEVDNKQATNIQLTNANNLVDKKYLVYHIKDGAERYSVASVKVFIYSDMITEDIQANVYDGISMTELNGLTLNPDAEKTYYMIDDENNMVLITNYTKLIDRERNGRDLVVITKTEDETLIKRYSEFKINVYDKEEIDIAVHKSQTNYDLRDLFGTEANIYSIVNNGVNFSRENILSNTNLAISNVSDAYFLVEKNNSIKMYHINVYAFEDTIQFVYYRDLGGVTEPLTFTFDLYKDYSITDVVTSDLLGEVDPAATVDYFVLSDVEFDEGINITADSLTGMRFNNYNSMTLSRGGSVSNYAVGKMFNIVVRITTPIVDSDPSVVYKVIQVKLIPPVEITCTNDEIERENVSGLVVKIPTLIGENGCMTITYNVAEGELIGDILFVYNNTEYALDANLPIDEPGNYSVKVIYKLDSTNIYEIGTYVLNII
ncbi:MAG: hypothetical protein IJ008_04875, partial [Clostridia bacterium]|nr:hypothetical protein [Clostridia bacterium]